MSAGINEKANPAVDDVGKTDFDRAALEEKNVHHSELLVDANLMSHAFDAENAEHNMTAWEAVKAHPMACFWAFLMCFTIVRSTLTKGSSCVEMESSLCTVRLTLPRLWSLLTCS